MTNTPSELKVACVQLTSGIDLEYNRQQVEVALQEAVENGAHGSFCQKPSTYCSRKILLLEQQPLLKKKILC